MEKSTASKRHLKAARLSLCIAVMALFLAPSGQILHLSHVSIARVSMTSSHHSPGSFPRSSLILDPSARFLPVLQSVNDSQSSGYSVQVGAWGSGDSEGNEGVQVEIQTNSYNASSQTDDAFWVGDILTNGGFVQFGYLISTPGYYCLTAHITANGTYCSGTGDSIGFADARWFWAYFPNAQVLNDWYYGFGPQNSAGSNSTWHLYSILPNAAGDWSFAIDGVPVYTSSFPWATSTSPAHLVAEQASGPYASPLGPVEFRNLAYLGNDTLWHGVSALTSIDGCGVENRGDCDSAAYGVDSVGSNDILVGSNLAAHQSGQMVWQRQSSCYLSTTLISTGSAGSAPFNITLTDSVSSAQGGFKTDWWFGDGSHQDGNTTQTVTYQTPGNYTPLVRVLDSAGCLSEASANVSVTGTSGSGYASGVTSFVVDVIEQYVVAPANAYAPC